VQPSSADESLALAARAGIHRLAIPTPFAVGRINCYLIEDDPLTLVDTGPNSGKSLDELEQALAALDRSIEDLELIVITHQHMDHLGLTNILVRRSGAEVAAFEPLAPYLERFSESAEADDAFAEALMRRHGVPTDLATALRAVGQAFRAFGSDAHVGRPLRPGDTLELRDRSLQVLHRPGHSPSDTVFWDERREILLAGDHLLAHISSNPLITRPLEATDQDARLSPRDDERPRALTQYIESLRATRDLPCRLVLPGHGDPVVEHAALIDERFRMHERRARKMHRIISEGPMTAYEIAQSMWGNVAVTQAYLTLSEVLGHLDLLVDDGLAIEHGEGEVVRFEAVGR
jgi:glyoxylase-like metal-dependent hydrolase (beta-lactamase superfamily II)